MIRLARICHLADLREQRRLDLHSTLDAKLLEQAMAQTDRLWQRLHEQHRADEIMQRMLTWTHDIAARLPRE